MKQIWLAVLALTVLSACGGDTPPTEEPPPEQAPPEQPPPEQPPPEQPPPEQAPPPAATERTTPIAMGDTAPAFDGLPDGPAVVVFYRGHW